jgi:hypothetical protein
MAHMLADPQPISVRFQDRSPVAVETASGSYDVTCPSAWRETGEWWAGESEKDFYRVHSECGFAAVIGMCRDTREWRLYQVAD